MLKLLHHAEEKALGNYNEILIGLNSSKNSTPAEVAQNRHLALSLYKAKYGSESLFFLQEAFEDLFRHWRSALNLNGNPHKSLKAIFDRLNQSLCSTLPFVRYRTSLVSMESKHLPRHTHKEIVRHSFCAIHPDRRAVTMRGKLKLCGSCYQKALKLNMLHLPLDDWAVEILEHRKPRSSDKCVNHGKVPAYTDGLCVKCLYKVGRVKNALQPNIVACA